MVLELENSSSTMNVSTASGEASVSSTRTQTTLPPLNTTTKKKRNLPGMPDPDSEVIALSPKTLMATNRFVCEICKKGFQRDQNLQLHRRGHNLPWKLRQRTGKGICKRVYVCPEPSCVHHNPSRALGDLTGIKKHFSRKHGEKKWKCEKCSKNYAVKSDLKAHLKTCGTKEYKCDCGTLFSRRDSFITHRAYCDALTEEISKPQNSKSDEDPNQHQHQLVASSSSSSSHSLPLSSSVMSSSGIQISELQENSTIGILNQNLPPPPHMKEINGSSSSNNVGTSSNMLTSTFCSSSSSMVGGNLQNQDSAFSDLICSMARSETPTTIVPSVSVSAKEPTLLSLSSKEWASSNSTMFPSTMMMMMVRGTNNQEHQNLQFSAVAQRQPSPAMSATALLQKAAQMGAAGNNASLFSGFGLSVSSSAGLGKQENSQWKPPSEDQQETGSSLLGVRLPGNGCELNELMITSASLFGSRPTTLDFLGLGMGGGGVASTSSRSGPGGGVASSSSRSGPGGGGSFSALMNSTNGGFDMANAFRRGNTETK